MPFKTSSNESECLNQFFDQNVTILEQFVQKMGSDDVPYPILATMSCLMGSTHTYRALMRKTDNLDDVTVIGLDPGLVKDNQLANSTPNVNLNYLLTS